MYGLNLKTIIDANTADDTASIRVLKSPERMKEISKNVAKKISAVPKSPIRASAPTHKAENTRNSNKFYFV